MLLTAFLNRLRLANYRPRTVHSREMVLNAFAATLPGDLRDATRLDVEAFLARDLAPETRRNYLQALRSFYRWCIAEEYLTVDPTAKVPSIRVKKGTPRPIDTADLMRAVEQAPARMRAWLLLMSLGGLRCMEVAKLRPVDLLQTDAGPLLFLRETKGGGTATVPAHPEIVETLTVLPIYHGLWWDVTAHRVTVATSDYLRSLGITDGGHSLRHHFGSTTYRASGHDLLTVARLLRHASVSTSQTYAQLDPTRPAEVVNLVPRLRAV